MSDLADRLKALGVRLGAEDIKAQERHDPRRIESVLGAKPFNTNFGETYVVDEFLTDQDGANAQNYRLKSSLQSIATWARDERIVSLPDDAFAYLDTETTGLSGGAGTYAFLIGVGRVEGDQFHLAQFFMHDPSGEPAQLAALEEFLSPCQAIVTYNGKAFDVPLLWNRFAYHGWEPPFRELAHIDLLHLARKLWRDRLTSRSLGSIEYHILGEYRSDEDVPGWQIPQMYFDYLRSGDAQPLKRVFYHNAMDVISLAGLLRHTAELLDNPLDCEIEHGEDVLALAKLFEDIGEIEKSIELYHFGFTHRDVLLDRIPEELLIQAIMRLSFIYKRHGQYEKATLLWEEAAQFHHIEAHIELAKFYEHKIGDIGQASTWTSEALKLLRSAEMDQASRQHWAGELEHRLSRLHRKSAR